jgi:hypothetical protein
VWRAIDLYVDLSFDYEERFRVKVDSFTALLSMYGANYGVRTQHYNNCAVYSIMTPNGTSLHVGKSNRVCYRTLSHYRDLKKGNHTNFIMQTYSDMVGVDKLLVTIYHFRIDRSIDLHKTLSCGYPDLITRTLNLLEGFIADELECIGKMRVMRGAGEVSHNDQL